MNVLARKVSTAFPSRSEQNAASRLQNVGGSRSTKFRHLNPADTRAEQTQSMVMCVGQEVVNAVEVVGAAVAVVGQNLAENKAVGQEILDLLNGKREPDGNAKEMLALKLAEVVLKTRMQDNWDRQVVHREMMKEERLAKKAKVIVDADASDVLVSSSASSSTAPPTAKAKAKAKAKPKAKGKAKTKTVTDPTATPESDALRARWDGDDEFRLKIARETVDMDAEWNLFVRSWGRPDGVVATLEFLEKSLEAESHALCWVLLAAEDKQLPAYVKVLSELPFLGKTWLDRVIIGRKGAANQRVFAGSIFEGSPMHVVMCDDNIRDVLVKGKAPCVLERIFEKACKLLDVGHMTLWGCSQAGGYLKEADAVSMTTSFDNALIYGALFGFRASANHVTLHGDVRDDIETSLRHATQGGVCRFMGFHVQKHGKPGAFKDGGGGISDEQTAESHADVKAKGAKNFQLG